MSKVRPKTISRKSYRAAHKETNDFLNKIRSRSPLSEPRCSNSHTNASVITITSCLQDHSSSHSSFNSETETPDSEISYSFEDCTDGQPTNPPNFIDTCSHISSHQINDNFENGFNIRHELSKWSLKHNITHTAFSDLLKLLKQLVPDLPGDSRTLLKTPRMTITKNISQGHYFHFGLKSCLETLVSKYSKFSNPNCLAVFINIDGLPLAKSSSNQVYPILCSLVINPTIVEAIGIYQGLEKPKDANAFLEDFVSEAIHLIDNGLTINSHKYSFEIKGFICDVPAKCHILYTKGHTGYYSCSKCDIEGVYFNGRVCFPDLTFNLRNNASFRQRTQEEYHTGTSILETIPNFDMVQSFPLDPMHLFTWVLSKN